MANIYEFIYSLNAEQINFNPRLSRFARVLCEISRMDNNEKRKLISLYADVTSKIFSDPAVRVDHSSFYWKLLNKIYKLARLESSKQSISKEDDELFISIIDVSQRLFAGSIKDIDSVTESDIAEIQQRACNYYSKEDGGILKAEIKEAVSKIQYKFRFK